MDNSNSNPPVIANCSSCQGLVRVPVNAPANSSVRCPHCSASFALSEVLADAIPELELVDESEPETIIPRVDQVLESSSTEGERQKFEVPVQLKEGARRRSSRRRPAHRESSNSEFRLSPEEDDDSGSGYEYSENSNGESNASIPGEFGISEDRKPEREKRSGRGSSSSRRSSRRSSRKKPSRPAAGSANPSIELIKVVLGGLLAIPIAYLLVLGVFQQDPLKLAPTIEKYVPFVVPEKLRTQTNNLEESSPRNPNAESSDDKDEDDVIDLSQTPLPVSNLDPSSVRSERN